MQQVPDSVRASTDEYVVAGKVRLVHIDVLRAVAALAVFFVHIEQYWLGSQRPGGANVPSLLTHVASVGAAGVDIFIVLSGFCLSYPLYRGGRRNPRTLLTLPFYKRRAFRILPAYYAVMLILFVLELVPAIQRRLVAGPVHWYDPFAHMLGVQSLFSETTSSINGPFWSIALELQLYVLFPLLILLVHRCGLPAAVGLTVVVFACWYPALQHLGGTSVGFAHIGDPSLLLPARWFEFALGVVAARLVANPGPNQARASLAIGVISLPLALYGEASAQLIPRTLGWALLGAALVVLGPHLPASWWECRPLSVLRSLGVISFSFYLVHQPVQLALSGVIADLDVGITTTFALASTVGVGVTVAVAYLSFRLFERPFLVSGGMSQAIRD